MIRVKTLEENRGAASVELTADDPREIDGVASNIEIQGPGIPSTSSR